MCSFIDFLVAEARKGDATEHLLLYAGIGAFAFLMACFLHFLLG